MTLIGNCWFSSQVRERVLQRPDAFRVFAACDDDTLDRLMEQATVTGTQRKRKGQKR
jgi:hypothetical protein